MSDAASQGLGTRCLHAGQEPDPTTLARAVPIYSTTSYVFKDTEHAADLFALKEFGNIYSRLMNPTNDALEKRLAALDGGLGALTLSSGMAAITTAILNICHAGQNFISATSLYGGTWTLFTQTFPKLGIEAKFFRNLGDRLGRENLVEALLDGNHLGIGRVGHIAVAGSITLVAAIVECTEVVRGAIFQQPTPGPQHASICQVTEDPLSTFDRFAAQNRRKTDAINFVSLR